MTNLTPHEARQILELTDAGMSLPPELHRRALEFCAEVDEAADEMRRRYLAMPWWRRILFRWGWR